MAPEPRNQPYFAKEEKVLCFHHDWLYEAKVLDSRQVDPTDKKSPWEYKIHYKGWKATWDDWVNQDRMRKNTEENRELQRNLKAEFDMANRKPTAAKSVTSSRKKAMGSDLSSGRGSEDRHSSVPAGGRGTKRGRDNEIEKVSSEEFSSQKRAKITLRLSHNPYTKEYRTTRTTRQSVVPVSQLGPQNVAASPFFGWPVPNDVSTDNYHAFALILIEKTPLNCCPCKYRCRFDYDEEDQEDDFFEPFRRLIPYYLDDPAALEESFYSRPSIRLVIPDNLKAILVDDWEYITKNLQLVPLPSKTPVNIILDTYFDEEKGKRRLGSAEADLLEEVVVGAKEYFERSLGKLLLYRFERQQYSELHQSWQASGEKTGPGDVYGAEHLVRMIVQMPEIIAQTNMDQQSVIRLKEELTKLCLWLGKNSTKYFSVPYENASQEYIEKSRRN